MASNRFQTHSNAHWLSGIETLEDRLLLAADFKIVIEYPPPPAVETYTTQQKAIIRDAADRWEEVITGTKINNSGTHTLTLQADIDVIDGAGKVLGVGGYNSLSNADKLPVTGHFTFDKSDIDTTTKGLGFFTTIMHEIGHAIGVGTLWKAGGRDLIDGEGTNNPRFNGPDAIAAYKAILDPGATSVPVQIQTGGDGYGGHWRENALGLELMTPTSLSNAVNPLSRITVGSLSDLGYTVNTAAADGFGDGFAYVSISQQLNGGGFDSDQNEGTGTNPFFGFLVYRAGDTSGSTTVTYEVDQMGSDPADADDFTNLTSLPSTNTLTFSPGESFKGLFITVNGDALAEYDETFEVTILSVNNSAGVDTKIAGQGGNSAKGVIRTDDGVPPGVTIVGTTGNDVISFETNASGYVVKVNGAKTNVSQQVKSLVIRGLAGNDRITVKGSAASEKAVLRPGSVKFFKSGFRLNANSVEKILVTADTGNDTAQFIDSNGNDKFTGKPNVSIMKGSGFSNRANGFDVVKALARKGADIARLFDSSGNDTFSGKAKSSQLKGTNYRLTVRKFDKVYAKASGGNDIAKLYGTSANDKFYGFDTKAKWLGAGFIYQVKRFDVVNGYAGTGTKDKAILKGSAQSDKFLGRRGKGTLSNTKFLLFTNKFDIIKADGRGGVDSLDARNVAYTLRPVSFENVISNT